MDIPTPRSGSILVTLLGAHMCMYINIRAANNVTKMDPDLGVVISVLDDLGVV